MQKGFNLCIVIAATLIAIAGLGLGADGAGLAAVIAAFIGASRLLMHTTAARKDKGPPYGSFYKAFASLQRHPERWVWDRGWRWRK